MTDEYKIIETLEHEMTYLFITRDKTIFDEQIALLNKLKSKIIETKNKFIAQQDENNANKWLSIEYICLSIIDGLNLFVKLKENDPDTAWNHLIGAQHHVHWSCLVCELPKTIQRDCFSHFSNIELVVFPPQEFMSTSLVTESKCGICQKVFSECDHIRGEAYMGRMCTEIATKIRKVNHVAIVTDPDDKSCRVTHYGNKNPPTVNKMTLLDESVGEQNN